MVFLSRNKIEHHGYILSLQKISVKSKLSLYIIMKKKSKVKLLIVDCLRLRNECQDSHS